MIFSQKNKSFKALEANVKHTFLAVSDLHISHANDPKALKLVQLLELLKSAPPEHFVFLGDVFDFCLFSSAYFKQKFAAIFKATEDLANAGSSLYFVEGNHEFGSTSRFSWMPSWMNTPADSINLVFADLGIACCHGDLIYSSEAYLRFRNFIKSRTLRFAGTFLTPPALLDKYALFHSKTSRKREDHSRIKHDILLSQASEWLTGISPTSPLKYGIFGHHHIPYEFTNLQNQQLLSLWSWDIPNFLAGSLVDQRICWQRGLWRDGQWQISQPATP